jgi:hypothetical protein
MNTKARDSCWAMFSKVGILTLYSQYIFSILMFVVKHEDIFTFNIELHKINTCHKLDLHVPSVNLTEFQKGVYYSGITLFNSLPLGIKKVAHSTNKFKHELKRFLIKNSFYSVEKCMDRDAAYDIGVLLNSIWIEMLHMILVFC